MLPEEDQATAVGNMYKKLDEDWTCPVKRYAGGQMNTHTWTSRYFAPAAAK